MNPKVDLYFLEGCGRCPLGGTPDCKVHNWIHEMAQLRRIILDCGLTEDLKWSVPCYTFEGSNILILAAFKGYAALSFFKGALLEDANGLLEKPGEHAQSGRYIPFTDVPSIVAIEPVLKAYIFEAIEVEKAGLKVDFKAVSEYVIPEELQQKMEENPVFNAAFHALTPGRQKGYLIYFAEPKQAKTRAARIEKSMERVFKGIGVHDRD